MLIDWFTLVAQVVNFIILVVLLKFLLFKRVLKALDEREDQIAKRLALVEHAKTEADRHQESLNAELAAYELAKDTRVKALENEVQAMRKDGLERLHNETQEQREEWQRALREDQDHFLEKLKTLGLRHLTTAMREAIDALANSDLESSMARAFVAHLKGLSDEEQRAFLEGIPIDGDAMEVESRFPLESDVRAWLSGELKAIFRFDGEIRFLTKDESGCGLRLRMGGRILEWSLDHYFDQWVERLRERLQEELNPEARVAA